MNYTPPPWKIWHGGLNESDEGFSIGGTLTGHTELVAECWPCTTTPELRREMLANARMIIAAPDLLEACQECLKVVDACYAVTGHISVAETSVQRLAIEAAIAKALGRAAEGGAA